MRKIDDELRAKYESALQTAAADADPSAVVWISRPTVPLTDPEFLDSAAILDAAGLTACDVAVRRPRADREADRVYVAYLDENGAHVKFSATETKLRDYYWRDGGFAAAGASDVAIAFDGTMPQKADGSSQFVTELSPWVFWITGGVLRGRVLGLLGETVLASANAGRVSAVRAAWAPASNVDFGLVVFFTLNGALYYRQLIGGEWMDAVPVTFGPSGVTWTDIRAFRTWDYRVGVQALGSDGKVYELFTQFQGLAKHSAEHIDLALRSRGDLVPILYIDGAEHEHLALSVAVGAPYGGFYRTGVPQLIAAENVNASGDWGRRARFRFDRHLAAAEVAAQHTAFRIVDSLGGVFVAQTAALESDGLTVRLTFLNFNGASGVCQARYVPGTVHSMAGAALEAASLAFTPQHLVPPAVPSPAVVSVTNDGDTRILIAFSADLIGDLTDAAAHFAVRFSVPDWSPGGPLHEQTRTPVSVVADGTDGVALIFAAGNQTALNNAYGDVAVEYDGAGPLQGEGGPVYPFTASFTPEDLTPKNNHDDAEHIELDLTALGSLIRIYHTDAADAENIGLAVTAAGTLTHVDDL